MAATNLTRDDAARRAQIVSDVTYDVVLDVTTDEPTFATSTRVTFSLADGETSTFLDLDMETVDRVVVNGQEVPPVVVDGHLTIEGLSARNEVVVEARGRYSNSGAGLHRFVDPVDSKVFLYTQFEPFDAHRVYTCFDQPDLKAPFTLAVHAPAEWTVVSNAPLEESPADGQAGRWAFAPTPPISTYLTAVVAGPYHVVEKTDGDVPLALYCRQSLAEHLDPDEIFEITEAGLRWFADAFDHPYPFAKYDQLFVAEFNFGAMENPGCVTFSESYIYRSRVTQAARLSRANTILHEMAHMWFGDLVTMTWWDDLWLNESFATFIAHTAVAEATRFGEDSWSDFAHSMKAWAYQQDQLPSTHPIVADIVDAQSVMANFDGITYAKGASVLKQLYAWVGREAFFEGLSSYFQAHAWSNASLADFLSALEGPSGRDLGPWSETWLQTAGVATLSLDVTDEDGTITGATLRQVAPEDHPDLRPHRIRFGLYDLTDDGLRRTDTVETDVDGATTEIAELVGRRRPAVLLVNDDDLAYAKVRLDDTSIANLEDHLSTIDLGVGRAIIWGSLWDATRDGELAAARMAELIIQHGPSEPDISVLQTLLSQLRACADRFGHPSNRAHIRDAITSLAHAQLAHETAGSDLQLVWVNAILSAHTDLSVPRALLDGSHGFDGLSVDPELRWSAVTALVSSGDAGAELVAAERVNDPTDVGERAAAGALAAMPTEAAKAEAWARAADRTLPMHTRRAVLRGFYQVDQEDLLAGYATQAWVDALPALWEDSNTEEALNLTRTIYPTAIVSQAVVEAADRALELDLSPVAKRPIREARDSTLRGLRARAADRPAS